MSQDRTLQESQYRLSVSFIGFYESYLSAYRHRTILAYRSDSSVWYPFSFPAYDWTSFLSCCSSSSLSRSCLPRLISVVSLVPRVWVVGGPGQCSGNLLSMFHSPYSYYVFIMLTFNTASLQLWQVALCKVNIISNSLYRQTLFECCEHVTVRILCCYVIYNN